MKKILFLVVLALAIGRTSSAQNAINSVHFYDVKNAAAEQTYIATLKEINAIMVEIGYPKNYYSHLKLAASDTTKTYRNCTIGHWNSEGNTKRYMIIQNSKLGQKKTKAITLFLFQANYIVSFMRIR